VLEVRIASLSCSGEGGVEAALESASCMIAEACLDKPDLICLPEIFAWTYLAGQQKLDAAEPVGGRVTSVLSELAVTHRVNVLAPLLERCGDRVYNSLVWLDRYGQPVGTYRKVFPTDYEMAEGIFPGPLDFNVFDTEYGPIGCCICFDLNFRQVIERIAKQNAKLVVSPTMFDGIALMKAWAKLYGMYLLACPYGSVVNPLGETILQPWSGAPIVHATVNLDYVVLHADYNKAKLPAVKQAYGGAVEIHRRDAQSCLLLVSKHPEKSAGNIAAEFELELEKDYLERSASMRDRILSEGQQT
jgi:beta-ureidopropionase